MLKSKQDYVSGNLCLKFSKLHIHICTYVVPELGVTRYESNALRNNYYNLQV